MNIAEVWVDKETGVNYLYHASGYSAGLIPLLDKEGKPVISSIINVNAPYPVPFLSFEKLR